MNGFIKNDSIRMRYLLLNCIQIDIHSDKATEKQYVSAQYLGFSTFQKLFWMQQIHCRLGSHIEKRKLELLTFPLF